MLTGAAPTAEGGARKVNIDDVFRSLRTKVSRKRFRRRKVVAWLAMASLRARAAQAQGA